MFCGSETASVSLGKGESEERSGESRKPHFIFTSLTQPSPLNWPVEFGCMRTHSPVNKSIIHRLELSRPMRCKST